MKTKIQPAEVVAKWHDMYVQTVALFDKKTGLPVRKIFLPVGSDIISANLRRSPDRLHREGVILDASDAKLLGIEFA